MRDTGKLTLLQPQRDSGRFVVWRLVRPEGDESCRWITLDGRWISLVLGHGEEIGQVVVADSQGRRVLVDSYEGALDLAKLWRQ